METTIHHKLNRYWGKESLVTVMDNDGRIFNFVIPGNLEDEEIKFLAEWKAAGVLAAWQAEMNIPTLADTKEQLESDIITLTAQKEILVTEIADLSAEKETIKNIK